MRAARLSLRCGVLEERRIARREQSLIGKEKTTIRNEIAHGGDILGDVEAMKYVEAHRRLHVGEYKDDFQDAYGLPFDEALVKLPLFSQEVIRAFDVLASVRELNMWQKSEVQNNRATIQQLASEITKAALNADIDQFPECFERNDELMEKYDKMDMLFIAGR